MEVMFKIIYYLIVTFLTLFNEYNESSTAQEIVIENTLPTGLVSVDFFETIEYILYDSSESDFYYAGDVEYDGSVFYQFKRYIDIGHEDGGWFTYTVLIQHVDYVEPRGKANIIIFEKDKELYRGEIASMETTPAGVHIIQTSFGTGGDNCLMIKYWHLKDIRFDAVYVYDYTEQKEIEIFGSDYVDTRIITDEQLEQLYAMLEKDEVYQEYWGDATVKGSLVFYGGGDVYCRMGPLLVRFAFDKATEKFNVVDYIYCIRDVVGE